MSMKFTLQHKDPATKARAGELTTDHGVIRTPIFMPVGTAATVKGIFHRDVRDEARAQIILANTYHLYMRPGMEIIEKAGGVHRFSTWEGPMLTDSGGFQVFSLAACRKREDLKSAAVSQHRAFPRRETVHAAGLFDDLHAGPHVEVVGVGQNDLRTGFVAHVAVENALDRRRRAHGHENRGADDAVVGRQLACAGFGRRILML